MTPTTQYDGSDVDTDQLPSPPSTTVAPTDGVDFGVEIPAELMNEVPKFGDNLPAGTYTFRLDSFETAVSGPTAKDAGHPYYRIQYKCQEEPFAGRTVYDNVPWVKKEDVLAATNKSDPNHAEAKARIMRRLPKSKEIQAAAGFTPTGNFNFEHFLSSNPVLRIRIDLEPAQEKGPDGKWHNTADFRNVVKKYLRVS